jgi:hypothetical protein
MERAMWNKNEKNLHFINNMLQSFSYIREQHDFPGGYGCCCCWCWLGSTLILRTDCIKDWGVDPHFDCKLHFHLDIDFLFSYEITGAGIT